MTIVLFLLSKGVGLCYLTASSGILGLVSVAFTTVLLNGIYNSKDGCYEENSDIIILFHFYQNFMIDNKYWKSLVISNDLLSLVWNKTKL